MDGFYSGRPGASFTIKDRFDTISQMVASFKQGAAYKNVWYDEYCIIDTKNKNNPDNGKIYYRGLDYQDDMGGAVYVGQIVGPKGGTPYFQMGTIDEIKEISKTEIGDLEYMRYPTGYRTNEDGRVIGYITSDGTDNAELATFPFSQAHDTSLVPGKSVVDGKTEYKDEITWTWCNIRQDNEDADSWFYVGFEIPYMVTDYSTHQVDQYDDAGNIIANPTEVERIDDYSHPFYEHWELGIPKGIKGDTLRNLRVITPTTQTKIYDVSSLSIDTKTGEANTTNLVEYAGKADDIANERKILVFDYYVFDKKRNPEPISFYLGDFNIITNIKLDDNGTLTVSYTHEDDTVFPKVIKWITNVSLTTGNGAAGGHFKIEYNNGDAAYETDLTWVKGIEIQEDGTVVYTYAGAGDSLTDSTTGIKKIENLLKWVKQITLDKNTGEFKVVYNNGYPDYVTTLDWVDDVYINETTGLIQTHHVNPAIGTKDLDAKLKLIVRASVDSTGVTTFYTNTGETIVLQNENGGGSYHIKTVDKITLNSAITDDKHIFVKYNTETNAIPIGDPINYVQDMVVRSTDWHLLVLYSDPEHRAIATDLDEKGMATKVANTEARYKYIYGTGPWVSSVINSSGSQYDSSVYWRDYGTIKDQSGVLIGFNLTRAEIGIGTDVVAYLNQKFPNGLTGDANQPGGASSKDKIITFSETDTDNKSFYAFDYNRYQWYYLGNIADSGFRDVRLLKKDTVTSNDRDSINTKGILFTYESVQIKDTGIPKYWDSQYIFTE